MGSGTLEASAAVVGPIITQASRLRFHEFVVHRAHGRDPLIFCSTTGTCMEVEDETLLALKHLSNAATVGAAETALANETGELYDLVDLADRFVRAGFVASVDDVDLGGTATRNGRVEMALSKIAPETWAIVRHPLVVAAGAFLVLQYVFLLFMERSIRPGFRDLFPTPRPALNIVLLLGGMIVIAALHELGHYAAARSYGIRARVTVGHRWGLITMITDVTEAWTLSRGPRIVIFSAGVAVNATLLGLTALIRLLGQHDIIPVSAAADDTLRFFGYLNIFPLVFQLFFTGRTDFYHVFQAIMGTRNLLGDSRAYLAMRLRRIRALVMRRPSDRCPTCAARVHAEEPFCVRCGTKTSSGDVNRNGFRFEDRRLLYWFGIASVVGATLTYPIVGFALFSFAWEIRLIITYIPEVLALGNWLAVAEITLALAFLLLQFVFIARGVLGGLVAFLWATAKRLRVGSAAAAAPASAATAPHSAAADPAAAREASGESVTRDATRIIAAPGKTDGVNP